MIPVVSIVGWSNSGKTTYLEKLIRELKSRGYRIAVIKHASGGFEMDRPGTDTWRHAQAGADVVCIASPHQAAIIQKRDREWPLAEIAASIQGVDLIFTEGYKREAMPKIEVFRQDGHNAPACGKEELLAVAADAPLYEDVPSFGLEDPASMADFLVRRLIRAAAPTENLSMPQER